MGYNGATSDAVIAVIKNAEFPRGRRHWAYDARDVDGFLDRLIDACREGRATAAMIDRAEFGPPPRLGDRYDEYAVDVLLDDVRDMLEHGSASLPYCPESLHRRPIWRSQDGAGLPRDALLAALAAHDPRDALLIGCSEGGLALDLDTWIARSAVHVLDPWTDQGLVTIDRPDASLDLVCAPWTLYLAADVDQLLGEIARVLRPQGALLATADGREHLAQLWALTDSTPAPLAFDAETGPAPLRRHFGAVERVDFATRVDPRTWAEAQDLLAWQSATAADALPESATAQDYAGQTTLFIATPTA